MNYDLIIAFAGGVAAALTIINFLPKTESPLLSLLREERAKNNALIDIIVAKCDARMALDIEVVKVRAQAEAAALGARAASMGAEFDPNAVTAEELVRTQRFKSDLEAMNQADGQYNVPFGVEG